ncbi:DUF692 domain-containing protein [Synechococcus sp. RSCCF101]|uniref:MNIO family bufferin maturase n=1 Tax=Synechococcus sp. RSCCF101 TaxID=2511069 RepID=UPI001246ED3E|nr:DUF692 domain-containing protein [Synechococcus sp. RSCCF101]QEY32705.1 DUF692 domain-containing protein [Synechococcus sp. RSCCF101]
MAASCITGVGLGLRSPHYADILSTRPAIPWFEALSDNYLGGGLPLHHLSRVRETYPITLHGVGLSLGSVDPLNTDYLQRLKALVDRMEPALVSDHLAWVSRGGRYFHDLAPLPYTEEALVHVVERVQRVQELLGRRILLENLSPYVSFAGADYPEWAFLAELADRADCFLLLDVNNVFVNAFNHGFDPEQYLDALPAERVKEIHLAGYEEQGCFLFDTHGREVQEGVWALYRRALQRFPGVPALIEWDNAIPPFDVLLAEAAKAEALRREPAAL